MALLTIFKQKYGGCKKLGYIGEGADKQIAKPYKG